VASCAAVGLLAQAEFGDFFLQDVGDAGGRAAGVLKLAAELLFWSELLRYLRLRVE
jgi:hypothetical protein